MRFFGHDFRSMTKSDRYAYSDAPDNAFIAEVSPDTVLIYDPVTGEMFEICEDERDERGFERVWRVAKASN
jgi:hypothetical protein